MAQEIIVDSMTDEITQQKRVVNSTSDAAEEIESTDFDIEEGLSFIEALSSLPRPIRNFYTSSSTDERRIKIFDDFSLTQEERDIALFTETQVVFNDLDLADYPNALWSRLPWEDSEEERAKNLIIETVGQIFLPISAYLGDVVGLLTKLGADPKKYAGHEIEIRSVSFKDGIKEIIEAAQIKGLDQNGLRRLENIIESRLRGVRDDLDTRATLTKSKKIGGLELSAEEAGRIIEIVANEMSLTKYVEQTNEREVSEASAESSKFTPEQVKQRLLGSAEEQAELAKRVENLNQPSEGQQVEAPKERLYQLVFEPNYGGSTDGWNIVAALFILAKQGGLLEALSKDDRYREGLKMFAEGRDVSQLKTIKDSPAGRVAVNMFLQVTLRGVAGLSDEDAARYGLRILNLLKKAGQVQYSDLVAFDLDEGKFVWTEPVEM